MKNHPLFQAALRRGNLFCFVETRGKSWQAKEITEKMIFRVLSVYIFSSLHFAYSVLSLLATSRM